MTTGQRPLSPHLTVYKLPLPALMSIFHRMTGVGLAIGLVLLVYWFDALALGPQAYHNAQWFFSSIIGRTLLLGWTYCLYYHLLNGIRHLFWDVGRGFKLPTVYATGKAVIAGSVVLTLLTWAAGYYLR